MSMSSQLEAYSLQITLFEMTAIASFVRRSKGRLNHVQSGQRKHENSERQETKAAAHSL